MSFTFLIGCTGGSTSLKVRGLASLRLLLLAALAALVVAACAEGDTGSPTPTATEAPEATETPVDPAIVDAASAYAEDQGWDLVGPCFGSQQGVTPAVSFCYFQPTNLSAETLIYIGRVGSGDTYLLTLEEQADGTYHVIDVVHSADIPSDGPP